MLNVIITPPTLHPGAGGRLTDDDITGVDAPWRIAKRPTCTRTYAYVTIGRTIMNVNKCVTLSDRCDCAPLTPSHGAAKVFTSTKQARIMGGHSGQPSIPKPPLSVQPDNVYLQNTANDSIALI